MLWDQSVVPKSPPRPSSYHFPLFNLLKNSNVMIHNLPPFRAKDASGNLAAVLDSLPEKYTYPLTSLLEISGALGLEC